MKHNCCNCKYRTAHFGLWSCQKQNFLRIYDAHKICPKFEPTFFGKLFNIERDPDVPKDLTDNCKKRSILRCKTK